MENSWGFLSGCLPETVLGYANCLTYQASQQWAVRDGFEFDELAAPGVQRWRKAFGALLRDAGASLPEPD